jgi:23S rRNA C2498 (ribose-2'-O)-methylase RlmM
MTHPNVTFIKGDAFSFKPHRFPVDYVLCDVIAFPQKTIDLIATWLSNKWAKRQECIFVYVVCSTLACYRVSTVAALAEKPRAFLI